MGSFASEKRIWNSIHVGKWVERTTLPTQVWAKGVAILWQKSQTKYRASSFLAEIVSTNALWVHSGWMAGARACVWTLQTFVRGRHNVKGCNMNRHNEETRLLACPALEAENTVCTLRPEDPEEESYDDRIFIIVFLTCHLQFIKIPGWAWWRMPLILALQRQRQGEISVHLRPAWSILGVLGHPRLHNEKMERKKKFFC